MAQDEHSAGGGTMWYWNPSNPYWWGAVMGVIVLKLADWYFTYWLVKRIIKWVRVRLSA